MALAGSPRTVTINPQKVIGLTFQEPDEDPEFPKHELGEKIIARFVCSAVEIRMQVVSIDATINNGNTSRIYHLISDREIQEVTQSKMGIIRRSIRRDRKIETFDEIDGVKPVRKLAR
jgi:hypothetical protein